MIETIHTKHFLYPPPPADSHAPFKLCRFLFPGPPFSTWFLGTSLECSLTFVSKTDMIISLASFTSWCGDLERSRRKAYMRRHTSLNCPLWDRFRNMKHPTINPVVTALCICDHYNHKHRKVTNIRIYQCFFPLFWKLDEQFTSNLCKISKSHHCEIK